MNDKQFAEQVKDRPGMCSRSQGSTICVRNRRRSDKQGTGRSR